jgi:hypothetical protein
MELTLSFPLGPALCFKAKEKYKGKVLKSGLFGHILCPVHKRGKKKLDFNAFDKMLCMLN